MRREGALVAGLLLVGVVVRVAIVLGALQHAATWEESWTATTARALLVGDCSLFWDGPYAPWTWVSWGESLLGVPVVALLGPSVAAWKVLPIALWCVVAFLSWRVVRRYAGSIAALLALALFVVGPPSLLHWSLFTTHGRITAWIGPLTFLLAAAPLVAGNTTKRSERGFLVGLLAGLSFVLHWDNALPCGIGLGLLVVTLLRREPEDRRIVPWLAGGAIVGSFPSLVLLLVRDAPFGIYQEGFEVAWRGIVAASLAVPVAVADSFVYWEAGGLPGRVLGGGLLAVLAGLAIAGWIASRPGQREGRSDSVADDDEGARRLRRFAMAFLVAELVLFPVVFAATGFGRARYFRSYFPPLIAAAGCGAAALFARRRRATTWIGVAGVAVAGSLQLAGVAQFLDRIAWGESLHYEYQDWRDGQARTLWEYEPGGREGGSTLVPPEVADAWRAAIERPEPRSLALLSRLLDAVTDPIRAQALQDMGFAMGHRLVRDGVAAEEVLVTIALAMPLEDAEAFLPSAGWVLGKRWLEGADATAPMLRLRERLPRDRALAFVGGFLESSWEPDAPVPWTALDRAEVELWYRRQRIEPREP